MSSNRKTLLVGLGGVGSKIVSRVYKEVPEEMRKNFVTHVFDTDVQDLKNLGFARENFTQTSTDMTIEQYLLKDGMKDQVKSWFITDHPSILKQSFASGAGQIRAISRLAYMASIGEGRLQSLDKKLSAMLKNEGNIDVEEIRIMIVSSLVGGTGAGIFLQAALYLKDYFETLGKRVMIRGTFLLPDIFIKTGIISNQQSKNILANGYACLKELNAIIGATSSINNKSLSTIELEYRPNMEEKAVTKSPYDLVFLYDYENTDGNHLGNYEQYLKQISKIVHLQLSTEIAGRADSIEINNIIDKIDKDGMARYASAGVSTIEYPYESILKYCALKLVNEKIGNEWLKIDKIYESLIERQLKDSKLGIFTKQLIRHEKMNELFDEEVNSGTLFYKLLNKKLYTALKDNELGPKKSDQYIENINKLLEERIETYDKYREFTEDKVPSSENLGPKGNIKNEVETFEERIKKYQRVISNSTGSLIDALGRMLIPEESDNYKNEYQLGYWIAGIDGEEMNPLVTRYFLNDIKKKISSSIQELNEELPELNNGIIRYEKDFSNTSDCGKNAYDRVNEVAGKKGFLGFGQNKELTQFREEYEEKSKKQFARLEEYRNKATKLGVYKEILKAIDNLLTEDIEEFFRALSDMIVELNKEAMFIAKEHEDKSDVSKIFVLSSEASKEKLYENVQIKVDVDSAINGMYKDIFKEQYSRFIKRKNQDNMRGLPSIKELYKEKIVNNYSEQISKSEVLNKNIIEAIKLEYDLFGDHSRITEKQYINELLMSTTKRARPLAMKKGSNETSLWAMNSSLINQLKDDEKDLFINNIGEILDSDFSKYEIVKYTSTSGLRAQDFDKFSSKGQNNTYFKGYMDVIERLKSNGNTTITPHLDKNWHLTAYMQDLNSEQAQFEKILGDRAFIYGLVYGYIKQIKGDDGKIWNHISSDGRSQKIKKQGENVKGKYLDLYTSMEFNPVLIDEIIERVKDETESDLDRESNSLKNHIFMKMAKEDYSFIDVLIKIREEAGNKNIDIADEAIDNLLDIFLKEIEEYVMEFYGPNKKNTAKKIICYFLIAALNSSKEYREADRGIESIEKFPERIALKVNQLIKEGDLDIRWERTKEITYDQLENEL